jgi:hypothetical protein
MSSRNQAEFDAAVRIEVLRARAALERLTLADHGRVQNPLHLSD